MLKNQNKAILVLNFSGRYGGAEKRYITLFNYIAKGRKDYYLIINESLYVTVVNNGLLNKHNNIIIIKSNRKNNQENKLQDNHKFHINNKSDKFNKEKSCIIKFFGQFKSFVKQFFRWIIFVKQFIKIVKTNQIKIVYSVWTGGIWSWPLKYLIGFKLIHSYNDSGLSSVKKGIINFFNSEYWVLKHCDKIDFLSEKIYKDLTNKVMKIEKGRILITPNSFINYSNYYSDSEKENSVVFLSRLETIKNPFLLLEAIKILNDDFNISNIKYYFLGNGSLYKEIKSFVNKNNLNNIFIEGHQSETWKYLKRSKIFISLQQENNYPSQSLLEAMACENAIIASDVGETRKLVTRKEGVLVNFRAQEIADAINKLIMDPDLIKQLGKNARRKVLKEHTIEKYVEYFYKITEE